MICQTEKLILIHSDSEVERLANCFNGQLGVHIHYYAPWQNPTEYQYVEYA